MIDIIETTLTNLDENVMNGHNWHPGYAHCITGLTGISSRQQVAMLYTLNMPIGLLAGVIGHDWR